MNDLISRQAAIVQVSKITWDDAVAHDVKEVLKDLPSAQPDTCDGCMWEDAFGYGECYRCKRAFSDMYMGGEGQWMI